MKTVKKILCVLLSVLLMGAFVTVIAFAQEDNSVTLRFLDYNVSGLPNFKALIGQSDTNVKNNQMELGKLLNKSDYDIIAVQEDFGYHSKLIEGMPDYIYKSVHSGAVVGGDGLNIYTKNSKIFNEKRIEWCESFGGIAEGDGLAPKGILYAVIDLGNDITLDFYDIHADAFDGAGSALARAGQYAQLLACIDEYSADRPVIITGDFNTSLHINNEGDNGADEKAMKELFFEQYGFKDAWIELENNGDYNDYSNWEQSGMYYWGNWDSVEKFLYRNGGGVEITPISFEYVDFFNSANANISDHSGGAAVFTFTKTQDFAEDQRTLTQKGPVPVDVFFNMVKWFIKDIIFIFKNLDELKALIGIG